MSGLAGVPQQDIQKMLKPEWIECQLDSDCTVIRYGCNKAVAANQKHKQEVTQAAYQYGGDPRAMNCLVREATAFEARCTSGMCKIK